MRAGGRLGGIGGSSKVVSGGGFGGRAAFKAPGSPVERRSRVRQVDRPRRANGLQRATGRITTILIGISGERPSSSPNPHMRKAGSLGGRRRVARHDPAGGRWRAGPELGRGSG